MCLDLGSTVKDLLNSENTEASGRVRCRSRRSRSVRSHGRSWSPSRRNGGHLTIRLHDRVAGRPVRGGKGGIAAGGDTAKGQHVSRPVLLDRGSELPGEAVSTQAGRRDGRHPRVILTAGSGKKKFVGVYPEQRLHHVEAERGLQDETAGTLKPLTNATMLEWNPCRERRG